MKKGNKEWLEWKYAGMISDAGGVYFTPYFLNGDELCMLLVNTKWIRFEKYEVNEDNYLFRLNDSLTSDIRKSASDNIARWVSHVCKYKIFIINLGDYYEKRHGFDKKDYAQNRRGIYIYSYFQLKS